MTLNWYSHKTKTQRKHRYGRGFWGKAHILDGPYRRRIERERVRFACGHETEALTMLIQAGSLDTCRRCLAAMEKRRRPNNRTERP